MFTNVKLPYTKFLPHVPTNNYYIIGLHSAQPWLEEFGIDKVCEGRDIKGIIGWIKPGHRIPIHLDTGPEGLVHWALDFTTEEFKDVVLEMYENLNGDNRSDAAANPILHRSYEIPIIEQKNSKLIASYSFTKGAVMFNPGKHWHTGYNPSKEKWMAVVSLRSWYKEDGLAIEEHFKKEGLIV